MSIMFSATIGRPHYFSKDFFDDIRQAVEEGIDVSSMRVKDWYDRLLKKEITHELNVIDNARQLVMTRCEYLYPQVDHTQSWKLLRSPGLSPAMKSTLFLLKNDLLPTRERLLRCKKASSSKCLNCSDIDMHGHFLLCPALTPVLAPLISALRMYLPSSSLDKVVNLDLQGEKDQVFIITWLLAHITNYIWNSIKMNIAMSPQLVQGYLKAHLIILAHIPSLKKYFEILDPLVSTVFADQYV